MNVLDQTQDYIALITQMLVHILHHHQQVTQQTLLQQRVETLVSDIKGKVEFSFRIPEYRFIE